MARKTRILVADDDAMVRMVVRTFLTLQGHHVEEAENGAEAVSKFEQAREAIDLVLMDYNMPGINGTDAINRLRRHDPNVRAILLSGGVLEREDLPTGHGVRYLCKPFQHEELVAAVRDLLDSGEPRVP